MASRTPSSKVMAELVQGGDVDRHQSSSSTVTKDDSATRAQADPLHPGFEDPAYLARRNAIAALSVDRTTDDPIPEVDYTPAEHELWCTLSDALHEAWPDGACTRVLDAVEQLALPRDHTPQLGEVNERLSPLTGFSYVPVPGLAPLRGFYSSFAEGRFSSTQYLRHHSSPLYTPEPDLVHEVLGHAHHLAIDELAALYRATGSATDRLQSDAALVFLSKVFWCTIEFGVVEEDGQTKAFGAGLLSSPGELASFGTATVRPLDFAAMGTSEYDITAYQPVLYGAPSTAALVDDLGSFLEAFDDDAAARLTHDRS